MFAHVGNYDHTYDPDWHHEDESGELVKYDDPAKVERPRDMGLEKRWCGTRHRREDVCGVKGAG